jgi:site-specific recombinase XerD
MQSTYATPGVVKPVVAACFGTGVGSERRGVMSVAAYEGRDVVEEWAAWFLDERGYSTKSLEKYRHRIEHCVRQIGKHPAEITTADLRLYLRSLGGRGPEGRAMATTRNCVRRQLRNFFRFLISQGYRTDDPTAAIDRSKEPDPNPAGKALSRQAARMLMDAAQWYGRKHEVAVRLFLFGGLRLNEAANLAWRAPSRFQDKAGVCSGFIDLDAGFVRVTKGKGSKARNVPMHPELREHLEAWREECPSDIWVLPRRDDPTLPIRGASLQRAVKRWARDADLTNPDQIRILTRSNPADT